MKNIEIIKINYLIFILLFRVYLGLDRLCWGMGGCDFALEGVFWDWRVGFGLWRDGLWTGKFPQKDKYVGQAYRDVDT